MENTIGSRLRQFREFKQMRQNAFSDATGVRQQTLSTIEAGGSEPSYPVLQKVFAAFPDLSADWLLTGAGPMLRDGRNLSPVLPSSDPDPDKPAGGLTVAHSIMNNPDALRLYHLLEDERAAHQRTREEHARDRERNHEVQVELIKHLGGKAEASADAAEDAYYEAPHMVAETNHAYQQPAPQRQQVAASWFGYADSLR